MKNFSLCIQFLKVIFGTFSNIKFTLKKYSWKEEKKGLFHDKEINEETYLLMDF